MWCPPDSRRRWFLLRACHLRLPLSALPRPVRLSSAILVGCPGGTLLNFRIPKNMHAFPKCIVFRPPGAPRAPEGQNRHAPGSKPHVFANSVLPEVSLSERNTDKPPTEPCRILPSGALSRGQPLWSRKAANRRRGPSLWPGRRAPRRARPELRNGRCPSRFGGPRCSSAWPPWPPDDPRDGSVGPELLTALAAACHGAPQRSVARRAGAASAAGRWVRPKAWPVSPNHPARSARNAGGCVSALATGFAQEATSCACTPRKCARDPPAWLASARASAHWRARPTRRGRAAGDGPSPVPQLWTKGKVSSGCSRKASYLRARRVSCGLWAATLMCMADQPAEGSARGAHLA